MDGPPAVLVATSINPIDWKLREGMKRPGVSVELPAILGRDASDEVVDLGPGVTRFRPGARVTGLAMGGYAERVVAKGEAWAEVPEGWSLQDAAALPLVTLTGSQLVEDESGSPNIATRSTSSSLRETNCASFSVVASISARDALLLLAPRVSIDSSTRSKLRS